jgi:DNA processing protein
VGAVPENGERAERLGTGGVAAGAGSFGGELGADEARVLGCFAGGAILTPDAVTGASGLASPVVTATLMMLELKRRVVKRTDGAYEAR